ncbi:MAG: serine hydrolase domain-containing protein [Bacteroidota bacterium]
MRTITMLASVILTLSSFHSMAVSITAASMETGHDLPGKSEVDEQSTDSIIIKGQFVWKDSAITGYPANVQITSTANPDLWLLQAIDSLGRFEKTLAYGRYTISTELNYHWMGEELVRIDEEESALKLEVNAATDHEVVIILDTIPWPKPRIGDGVLKSPQQVDFKAVDQFIKERMAFFEVPGATLSLIKDNQIIYTQIYGVTNDRTQKPVVDETLFEAGSITKLVFAFAVMRLYERGEIDLDKPLYEYLPSEEIDDERYKLMTARHVLSHQSGMSNWPRKDENGKFKLNFPPGARYGYSGKAFEYLKSVIQSITGKDIDTILQQEVLAPLQITDMYFKANDQIATRGANGHKKYIPSDIFMAKKVMVAYTLQSTSEALAKFALALHQRKGLKKETYDEMFKVHSERADGTKWGLGVRIEETSSGISYGHSGSTGRGFISNLVFYDNSGLGYVILTNSQMGGWLSLPLLNEYLILGNTN